MITCIHILDTLEITNIANLVVSFANLKNLKNLKVYVKTRSETPSCFEGGIYLGVIKPKCLLFFLCSYVSYVLLIQNPEPLLPC